MSDCVFCKIIAKQIPAQIVFENESIIAFLDINPVHPGHTLVLPKTHVESFTDLPSEICGGVGATAQKLMKVFIEKMGYEGANLIQNNGAAAGQVVPHVHFHVIPRKKGDGLVHWPGRGYENGQEAMTGAQVRSALSEF